jgi:UDP-hydrolysing UDP-N-acetyl-D-glucosamine 2-epimerase
MKRKVCVVVTARPSYSRVKTALMAIQDHPELELQLVVAASALLDRYGSQLNYIEEDGLPITERVYMVIEGATLTPAAKTTGIGIMELSTTFDNLKPDVVCTVGDRYETMATAIAASYMNIPLVHIQGGEVTGNIDEKVRHAVTKLSDLHLVSNEDAKQRLIKLGELEDSVFNTGCPSIDLAKQVMEEPNIDFLDLYKKYGGVGKELDLRNDYIVVMQHPVTTEYSESKDQINITLEAIKQLNIPTLWFWPNVDAGSDGTSKGIRMFREKNPDLPIHFFKNMEPLDFLRILKFSKCLIGNSSVGIRECAFLGVPVINIGSRQNRRERGRNVIDVSYNKEEIINAINIHFLNGHYTNDIVYGGGDAGKRIANTISDLKLKYHKTITY